MDVARANGQVTVTDAVGNLHVNGSGCILQGALVRCSDSGLKRVVIQGGNKNDDLNNGTDLPGDLRGGKGDDRLQGGSNSDRLNGEQGIDDEFGGAGNDDFVFEPGTDSLAGEAGTADRVSYAAAPSGASIQLDQDFASVAGETDDLSAIERAIGTPFNDSIDGSAAANTLSGLAGNDTIRGRDGNDVMDGGNGADSLAGDAGIDAADYRSRATGVTVDLDGDNDDGNALDGALGARDNVLSNTENLRGGNGNDVLKGQPTAAVANTLQGNLGDDTLDGGPGPDRFDGGAGIDNVSYAGRAEDVTVTLDGVVFADDGGASDGPAAGQRDDARNMEKATGGAGADHLFGTSAADILVGGRGVDEVDGRQGADRLEIRDGGIDQPVSCGAGVDAILADAVDLLANTSIPQECEQITAG